MSIVQTRGPTYIFHHGDRERFSKTRPYIGMELEVAGARRESRDLLPKIAGEHNPDNLWYYYDDWVTNGWEFVTHPMSFRYIQTKWNGDEFLPALATEAGTTATHDMGNHIHISKEAFDNIGRRRLVDFHKANKLFIVPNVAGYENPRYAKFEGLTVTSGGKGIAVNMMAGNTIELRYFRTTLNPLRSRGYLEWTYALWDIAQRNKRIPMTADNVKEYLATHPEYENALAVVEGKETHALGRPVPRGLG